MIKKAKKCCLLTVGALGLAAAPAPPVIFFSADISFDEFVAASVILKKEDIAFDEWCKSRK